jgi:hypothetical protein
MLLRCYASNPRPRPPRRGRRSPRTGRLRPRPLPSAIGVLHVATGRDGTVTHSRRGPARCSRRVAATRDRRTMSIGRAGYSSSGLRWESDPSRRLTRRWMPVPRASWWARRCGQTTSRCDPLSTHWVTNSWPHWISKTADSAFGAGPIYRTSPWRTHLSDAVARGVVRLHVTAIERDGTMRGPDLELYKVACASGIAVVAAGGVRNDADVESLARLGCEAAVHGRWLPSAPRSLGDEAAKASP